MVCPVTRGTRIEMARSNDKQNTKTFGTRHPHRPGSGELRGVLSSGKSRIDCRMTEGSLERKPFCPPVRLALHQLLELMHTPCQQG